MNRITGRIVNAAAITALLGGFGLAACSVGTDNEEMGATEERPPTATVGIVTSNPGSIFHNIGTAVANAANSIGLNATIQPATSPNQYIPLVNSGRIEFGVANLQEVNFALEGGGWFHGNQNPNLRIVGLIMPVRSAIFVRADSDIRSIADLRGRRMVDGFTAQQAILPQLEAMYATAGLTRSDIRAVRVPSVVAGADAFIAGDSVGFMFAHGAGKVREADAAVGGLRALPISDTEENLRRLRDHWPTAFLTEIEPSPALPGIEQTGTFMAYPQVVFTHADAPDDVVYWMAKVLYERKDILVQTFSAFALFEPDQIVGDVTPSLYHPGAIRYFEEIGLWNGQD